VDGPGCPAEQGSAEVGREKATARAYGSSGGQELLRWDTDVRVTLEYLENVRYSRVAQGGGR